MGRGRGGKMRPCCNVKEDQRSGHGRENWVESEIGPETGLQHRR